MVPKWTSCSRAGKRWISSDPTVPFDLMKPPKLSDQLRRAIDAEGISRYAMCKRLQISQALMSRFMAGTRGISLEVLDRIGELLGLSICVANDTRSAATELRKGRTRPPSPRGGGNV